MASTFFGLSIASSGLRAYQASANTVSNNISNVDTKGYSKQVTNMRANHALRGYTEYGTLSTGVSADSVTQVRSEYYDNKYWQYSGYKGEYTEKVKFMSQVESYFQDDDSLKGFSSIYAEFFNDIDSLRGNPASTSVRNQMISSAKKFCSYFNAVSSGLQKIQEDVNDQIKSTVDEINSIAQKIALLNDQINDVEINGGYANDMRDQRALLVDELSTMVAVDVKETKVVNSKYPDMYTGATSYTVKINGLELVSDGQYRQLECEARKYKDNQNDAEGLYDIKWEKTGNTFKAGASSMSGSLKALFDIRDGNNGENFRGVANVIDSTHVKITNPSISSIEAVTMPETGVLTIYGKDYSYKDFSFETDADGKIISYTFELKDALSTQDRLKVDGMQASIGSSVDTMGVPYYMSQMNQFLRSFCSLFNDTINGGKTVDGKTLTGQDLNGDATDYYSFFTGADQVTAEEYVFGASNKNHGKTV